MSQNIELKKICRKLELSHSQNRKGTEGLTILLPSIAKQGVKKTRGKNVCTKKVKEGLLFVVDTESPPSQLLRQHKNLLFQKSKQSYF